LQKALCAFCTLGLIKLSIYFADSDGLFFA